MTTIGHVLVSEILPPKYRDDTRTLGSKELEALLAQIAKEDPDLYKDISAKLMRLGNQAAYESGTTLRLSDILPPFDRSIVLNQLNQEEEKIRANPKLTEEQKTSLITDLYDKVQGLVKQQTYETSLAVRNPFAMQVKSKARGNQDQLAAMISTPGTYADSRGNTVPLFIQHSFADGLTPAEYWAGTFGGRLGIISSKFSTRKGGYLGKLLSQATVDQVVTEDDCGGAYGMPVKADDNDNIGAVLQQDAGDIEAGTVVTKEVLADLKKQNIDTIIVRSPITCACKDGICSKCCGIRETGNFPPIGYNLGLNASSALAERITQGALNCLAEGTLVRMADGSVKPIEQMDAGDMVFGCDTRGNITPTRVVARYDNGIQPCVKTHFLNGEDVVTTEIHKFLTKDFRVVQISECPDLLEVYYKSGELYFNADFNEQRDVGLQHVYDIEVDHPDHLFLLANGFICSNTKHTGKKAKGKSSYSGFEAIKNMTTVPGTYPDAAVVAEEDGKVDAIEAAPQGGSYVFVDGHRHYVAPGYDILVKPGDTVEAGDQLSDGVINPVDIVKYKGIGEGRRYFATRLTQMMRDSNYAVNRRNVEAIARSLVNHVQIDDEDAEAQLLPGDIATYTSWSFGYRPRENTKIQAPSQSIGQYLESPILHYTIGTKITKKTAEDMAKYGIKSIFANPNPVGVTPVMQSVVKSTGTSDDWMARLGTTYLKTRLTEDAQRGSVSRLHSTNPIPGVAKGVEFGNYFEPGVKRPGGYTY